MVSECIGYNIIRQCLDAENPRINPAVLNTGNESAMAQILKMDKDDEEKEPEFELAYQRTLTTAQRFELMFRKSREIAEVLLKRGYRKPFEIIKRT